MPHPTTPILTENVQGLTITQGIITIPVRLTDKEASKAFGPDTQAMFRLEGLVNDRWAPIANFHPAASSRVGRKGYFSEMLTRARHAPGKAGRKPVRVVQMPIQPTSLRIVRV